MDSQSDSQPSQDSTMTVVDDSRHAHEIIYFAYGSNLSTEQMLQRCPNSTPIGLGFIPAFGWIINARGYANIVDMAEHANDSPRPAASTDGGVYGLMYLLPPDDEKQLDGYEGWPWAYAKAHMLVMRVRDENGRPLEKPEKSKVLVYVDTKRTDGSVPKKEYVGRMEAGIAEAEHRWGMDLVYAERMKEWLRRGTQP